MSVHAGLATSAGVDPVDPSLDHALGAAFAACAAAGDEALQRHAELLRSPQRAALMTEDAAVAVERRLFEALAARTPAWGVLTPQRSHGALGGAVWIVDPLADMERFRAGYSLFGTLAALEIEGEPALAVVHLPALAKTWWGIRSLGAFSGTGLDRRSPAWKRLSTSSTRSLRDAFTYHDAADRPSGPLGDRLAALRSMVRTEKGMAGLWAHMAVAEGKCDAAIDLDASPFEAPAVRLIVEEAGGAVASGDVDPETCDRTALLSSNHPLAATLATCFTVI